MNETTVVQPTLRFNFEDSAAKAENAKVATVAIATHGYGRSADYLRPNI